MLVLGVEEFIQVLLSSLLWWCVYLKNTCNLVNRQAQRGSETVREPRANETAAFYTVRTKNKEWQVWTKGKQKTSKGRGLLSGECVGDGGGALLN